MSTKLCWIGEKLTHIYNSLQNQNLRPNNFGIFRLLDRPIIPMKFFQKASATAERTSICRFFQWIPIVIMGDQISE
jgi:hypothetical protein